MIPICLPGCQIEAVEKNETDLVIKARTTKKSCPLPKT